MLAELVLERTHVAETEMLYVHWLTLRNPLAPFTPEQPRLPGQETRGVGLARETGEMLIRMAERLHLGGLAYRPAWYHTAYAGRYRLRLLR